MRWLALTRYTRGTAVSSKNEQPASCQTQLRLNAKLGGSNGAKIGKTSSTDTTVETMYKHYYVISIVKVVKFRGVVSDIS